MGLLKRKEKEKTADECFFLGADAKDPETQVECLTKALVQRFQNNITIYHVTISPNHLIPLCISFENIVALFRNRNTTEGEINGCGRY